MTQNIEILGLIAAVITTTSFAPQVYKTWKTKSTEGISMSMYSMIFIGLLLWIVYGFYLKSMPIILANSITEIMVAMLLVFKLKYKT